MIEVLDPCHRNLWRALDFETTVNHYQKYDLHNQIPCPDTRAKALTDKAYGVRRSNPRDQRTDLRVAQRIPSNRNPPPIGAGTNTAQLRGIFENDERANVRRNLYNNQNSSPGNTGISQPPPTHTTNKRTCKGNCWHLLANSLGLSTKGTEQTGMPDTGTRTPVLSITPVEEDDELGDLFNKKTPTKDIITTMQQNIRDSLHPTIRPPRYGQQDRSPSQIIKATSCKKEDHNCVQSRGVL